MKPKLEKALVEVIRDELNKYDEIKVTPAWKQIGQYEVSENIARRIVEMMEAKGDFIGDAWDEFGSLFTGGGELK